MHGVYLTVERLLPRKSLKQELEIPLAPNIKHIKKNNIEGTFKTRIDAENTNEPNKISLRDINQKIKKDKKNNRELLADKIKTKQAATEKKNTKIDMKKETANDDEDLLEIFKKIKEIVNKKK